MAVRFRILPAPEELRAGWRGGPPSPPLSPSRAPSPLQPPSPSPSPSQLPSPDIAAGPSDEREFEITSELDEIRIGRHPTAEIELPFPPVSSFHARLYRGELPADWWVEDLGSTNGSWVDGIRLSPRRPVRLRAGQRLRIAAVDIVFEGWSAAPRGAESTATIARRLISDLFGVVGGDVPMLAIESGPGRPATLRLAVRDRRYLAGRADGCDLVFGSEHVSREHAAFIRRWDGVVVSDLGSKNGVLVNGRAIPGDVKLADGDRIEVGPIALRLTDPEDRYLRRMESLGGGVEGGPASSPEAVGAARARAPIATPKSTPIAADVVARAKAGIAAEAEAVKPPTSALAPLAGRSPKWVVSSLIAAVVVVAIVGLVVLLVATR